MSDHIDCPHCKNKIDIKKESVKHRLLKKVHKHQNGCWVWLGSSIPSGYGTFSYKGTCTYAHRTSYELFKGPIEDGLEVMHSCHNPGCVNPDHLSLGTHADNMAQVAERNNLRTPS